MTQKVILWTVATLIAAVALAAGCFAPSKPLIVIGDPSYDSTPAPKDRGQVSKMDRQALENEVLRLAAENTRLRQEVDSLKRKNKLIDQEKDRLEDRVEDLEDQVKDLRKR